MKVVTRFAPSPTGDLHIGSARTALFNYLFARHYGGKFLLRIEDTDKKRSTDESVQSILDGLAWLGVDYNSEPVYQSQRFSRHQEVAKRLLEEGKAYLCFTSQEEIANARKETISKGTSFRFESQWRDISDSLCHPQDIRPVLRIKAPRNGEMLINDLVQGTVKISCDHLDDLILLRSDGSPTYMFAVVVDDYDMGITHIIRGDDHLNNAFRQQMIFEACGFNIPQFAHIPLIYGADGAKMSKRHGAVGTSTYEEMGYLPEALFNYLLRLGWSHGNDEIISKEQAIKWFGLGAVGKGPARFDISKLNYLNAHYIKEQDDKKLVEIILNKLPDVNAESKEFISQGMANMKCRVKSTNDIVELSKIYVVPDILEYDDKIILVIKEASELIICDVIDMLENLNDYSKNVIQEKFKGIAKKYDIKIGELMKPIRAILTASHLSPSIFEIISILGKDHILRRLKRRL